MNRSWQLLAGLTLGALGCGDDCPLGEGDEKPRIVQLEAAGEIVMALYSDGTAFCWGEANTAQCGWGFYEGLVAAASCLVSISPGDTSLSAGIDENGLTRVWGSEAGAHEAGDGPGRGNYVQQAGVVLLPELAHVAASTAMFGVTAGGDVYWWGAQPLQFDPLVREVADVPRAYPLEATVRAAAVSSVDGACFLDDSGGVWCMGMNEWGQLGLPPSKRGQFEPRKMDLPGPAVDIGAADAQRCALLESGELYCWGYVYLWGVECVSESCEEGHVVTEVPQLMEGFRGVSLELGESATCVLDEQGKATCAGSQHAFGRGSLADTTLAAFAWEPDLSFSSIAIGLDNVCGLTLEGRVFCTGIFPHWVYDEEGYGREGAYIPIEQWYERARAER